MKKKDILIAVAIILVIVALGVYFIAKNNKPIIVPVQDNNKNQEDILNGDVLTDQGSLKNQLVAKQWTWDATMLTDAVKISPEQADAFTVTFNESGDFNGTTDCNNFFGSYETEGNSLIFGPMGSTKMYCEGSQESDFINSFAQADNFMIDDEGTLVIMLKLEAGSMLFSVK